MALNNKESALFMTPPKSSVVGSTGFIGSHLFNELKKHYPDLIGTSRNEQPFLDLRRPTINFSTKGYRWAIIAVGYSTPQRCIQEPDLCWQVDIDGTMELCREFIVRGITPVVLSTTQVFDGEQEVYYPHSPTSPTNMYGEIHAKREEILMREMADDCLIIRLCRIYGPHQNVMHEIVQKLLNRGEVEAAVDQELQLASIEELSNCLFDLQAQDARGIFQICPKEPANRYEMACYIAEGLGMERSCVKAISMSDIDNIPRPKSAYLASFCEIKEWKEGVDELIKCYRSADVGRG